MRHGVLKLLDTAPGLFARLLDLHTGMLTPRARSRFGAGVPERLLTPEPASSPSPAFPARGR
ncbi:MAG: hypothetical protein ACE5HU_00050 [Acidobacteriota bacterium]